LLPTDVRLASEVKYRNIEMRGAFRHVFACNTWWNLKRVENLGYRTKQWHSAEIEAQ
jgi:hypothetical protein